MKAHTHLFTITEEGQLNGQGADLLNKAIADNQFLVLGEYRGSKRIHDFTMALLPKCREAGYQTLGVEIGPYSAKKLQGFSGGAKRVEDQLEDFFRKNIFDDGSGPAYPVPYFDNTESAELISRLNELDMTLAGMDQEYIDGFPYLYKEMVGLLPESPKKTRLEIVLEQAQKDLIREYRRKEGVKDYYPIIQKIRALPSIQQMNRALLQDSLTSKWIKEINLSMDIYQHYEQQRSFANNNSRAGYFKRRFRQEYQKIQESGEKIPRMIFRLGSVHTGKGMNDFLVYTLGNTAHELAEFNGRSSLHIFFLRRYKKTGDKIVDYAEGLDPSDPVEGKYANIYPLADPEQWTLIDLWPVKTKILYSNVIDGHLKTMARRFDWVIIPPVDADLEYFSLPYE